MYVDPLLKGLLCEGERKEVDGAATARQRPESWLMSRC